MYYLIYPRRDGLRNIYTHEQVAFDDANDYVLNRDPFENEEFNIVSFENLAVLYAQLIRDGEPIPPIVDNGLTVETTAATTALTGEEYIVPWKPRVKKRSSKSKKETEYNSKEWI